LVYIPRQDYIILGMLVFLNGQIIDEESAKVSVSDLSYQFGYGLFETIRCERGVPLFFESHYKRLNQGAKEIGMPFPVDMDEVKKWIVDLLKANKQTSSRVKLVISKRADDKFNVLVMSVPLIQLPPAYSLLAKVLDRDPKSFSFKFKTTSRADSYAAHSEAIKEGFNDALFLNRRNELIECTRANIFLILPDKIITPVLESGILSGITRAKVIEIAKRDGFLVEEKNVHSLYLNKATDVFITSAIVGIMPVSRIKLESKEYNFSRGPKTDNLRNAYDSEVQEYLRKNCNLAFSA